MKNTHAELGALNHYFRDLRRQPRLEREHERRLLERIADDDTQAMQELVSAHLGFVVKIAREYQYLGLPLEDLINEGNIGLIEAAGRFDATRDNKFISYAVWWIRRTILHAVHEHSTTIRIPVSQRRRMRLERQLEDDGRHEAPVELPVARRLPRSVEQPAPWSPLPGLVRVSFDDRMDGMPGLPDMLVDESPDAEHDAIRTESIAQVNEALAHLTDRERNILRRRFGLDGEPPATLQEIGDALGFTREWVRQIEIRARRKLRTLLEQDACAA